MEEVKRLSGKAKVGPLKGSDDTGNLVQALSRFSKHTRGRNNKSPRDIICYYFNKKRHLARDLHALKRDQKRELCQDIQKDKQLPRLFAKGHRK